MPLTPEEREALETEWKEISARLEDAQFSNPVDVRRKSEITSLLMTDGESGKVKFKFVKGRKTTLGLNTKGYNRKGPVG